MKEISVTVTLSDDEYAELIEIARVISEIHRSAGYSAPSLVDPESIIVLATKGMLLSGLKDSLLLTQRCASHIYSKNDK